MSNKPKHFEEKKKKQKKLFDNSNTKKDNSNNNNIVSLEENEIIGNNEKNDFHTKDISEEIKKIENKSNDIKPKSLFGDLYTKDLSKEANKNSLLFSDKPLFSNNDYKNLFKGSSLFGDNNNKDESDLGLLEIKKKDGNSSSSSSSYKKKKKKQNSENSSGYSGDCDSESDSIENKINDKVNSKKKLRSKKRKKPDNKSNSSSSSNYHPEAHNFLEELYPYMSSDSEIEINNSEKSKDDKIQKEKENLDKIDEKGQKEKENLIKNEEKKEDEKQNEIKDEIKDEKSSEKEEEEKEKEKEEEEKEKEKEEEEKEKEKEEEEKEEKNQIIEFNEKYNNTKNVKSINYYTKKSKINKEDKLPSYDYIELKNSDDILYGEETKTIYDCKNKKIKLKIKHNFEYPEIKILKENYFINVSYEEIIIFHFEEFNTKMVIDQILDLPEDIEYKYNGIAPHLDCYPLNENFIIFKWSRNNNFYVYKNNSKEKSKIKFEQYTNIKLNKKAYVYENTSLEKILKINDNEFFIFAKSDQRPEPQFLFQAFMQGNKRHKESTYIAIYSFNSSKGKFEIKKSKINYEKGVDYGYEVYLLRKRFIFYHGNKQKRKGELVQVFDLETMEIISIFKDIKIKFYNISDKNDIFFIIKNNNLYEQYQLYNNGGFKKIGEAKLQNLCIEKKYKNGILYSGNKVYYLLTHE